MTTKVISLTTALFALACLRRHRSTHNHSTSPTWQDAVSQHHQLQYQMMKGMTEEMSLMTGQMSQDAPTPEQRQQMAQRMASMSTMMRRMSGLEARPAHCTRAAAEADGSNACVHGPDDAQIVDGAGSEITVRRDEAMDGFEGLLPLCLSRDDYSVEET